MIEYEQALRTILEKSPTPEIAEHAPLCRALGRALAENVRSDVDSPPFDKSAMDGFAVRADDVRNAPVSLRVVMDIPAGKMPRAPLGPRQAASIMTGAPLPEGADAVVQVEWTSGFGKDEVKIEKSVSRGANLSRRAEILKAGDTVLEAGARIGVEEIGLLATVGCDPVPVFGIPSVAVISTGDEVVPASCKPGPAQIRNSNGPSLVNFLLETGAAPVDLGHVGDDIGETRKALKKGLESDCLLITGGVSAGAYDFVEDVLAEIGAEIHFDKIAVKPGRPTVFGTIGRKPVFGLPGNPVSTVVMARVLVEPALKKMMGFSNTAPRTIKARLKAEIRKKPDRLWFVHGRLTLDLEASVEPVDNLGSADIPGTAAGNCLIMAPKGASLLERGSSVDVVIWNRCI